MIIAAPLLFNRRKLGARKDVTLMAWGFPRRLFLPTYKEPAASADMALFQQIQRVYLPLSYAGRTLTCRFSPGEAVTQGDLLTMPDGDDPLPAKSTVDGVFNGLRELSHPLYGTLTCAVIRPAILPTPRPESDKRLAPTPAQVLAAAKAAGIIDETDGVPLFQKLEAWQQEGCHFLVADAVESEPYASSAWALLRSAGEQINNGLWLASQTVGAAGSHIAVQASRKALRKLPDVLNGRLFSVPKSYPVTTIVNAGSDIRTGVIGVQACLALHRAVTLRENHNSVVITVSGDAVERPQNIRAPFGTPAGELLRFCGLCCNPAQVIMGDALTGVAIPSAGLPILPGVTCLLAMKDAPSRSQPCLGCGQCISVCHARLMPGEIARQVESMHYDRLPSLHPEQCDGCGACSYVCPAGRDIAALVGEAAEAGGRILVNWGDTDGS